MLPWCHSPFGWTGILRCRSLAESGEWLQFAIAVWIGEKTDWIDRTFLETFAIWYWCIQYIVQACGLAVVCKTDRELHFYFWCGEILAEFSSFTNGFG